MTSCFGYHDEVFGKQNDPIQNTNFRHVLRVHVLIFLAEGFDLRAYVKAHHHFISLRLKRQSAATKVCFRIMYIYCVQFSNRDHNLDEGDVPESPRITRCL